MKEISISGIEFYQIAEHQKYYISKMGGIYSIKSDKILSENMNGYPTVFLNIDGKYLPKKIHRLVAIQFLPNPENKPCVNHIDGNKTNYRLENLEWCTYRENSHHAWRTGLMENTRKASKLKTGHPQNLSTREKMSLKKLGKNHPKFKGLIVTPFGKFESSYEAGKAIGTSHTMILRKIKSEKELGYFIETV